MSKDKDKVLIETDVSEGEFLSSLSAVMISVLNSPPAQKMDSEDRAYLAFVLGAQLVTSACFSAPDEETALETVGIAFRESKALLKDLGIGITVKDAKDLERELEKEVFEGIKRSQDDGTIGNDIIEVLDRFSKSAGGAELSVTKTIKALEKIGGEDLLKTVRKSLEEKLKTHKLATSKPLSDSVN